MKRIHCFVLVLFAMALGVLPNACAEKLDNWKDPRAYCPGPLFMYHGFAAGEPTDWEAVKTYLEPYYKLYQNDEIGLPCMETCNFHSSDTLIERNESIDNYQAGDNYVQQGARSAGDPGWAQTAHDFFNKEYVRYNLALNKMSRPVILAHSMGGLAVREFLTSNEYGNNVADKVAKVITIGTPYWGSPFANTVVTAVQLSKAIKMFLPGVGHMVAAFCRVPLDEFIFEKHDIDPHGDAIVDLEVPTALHPNPFLTNLYADSRNDAVAGVDWYPVAGEAERRFANFFAFPLFSGDTIVSTASQLGKKKNGDVLFPRKSSAVIAATHREEPQLISADDEPSTLLRFLDDKLEWEVEPFFEEIWSHPAFYPLRFVIGSEYFPASCTVSAAPALQPTWESDLNTAIHPDDRWDPAQPGSIVAQCIFGADVNWERRLPQEGGGGPVTLTNPAGVTVSKEIYLVPCDVADSIIMGKEGSSSNEKSANAAITECLKKFNAAGITYSSGPGAGMGSAVWYDEDDETHERKYSATMRVWRGIMCFDTSSVRPHIAGRSYKVYLGLYKDNNIGTTYPSERVQMYMLSGNDGWFADADFTTSFSVDEVRRMWRYGECPFYERRITNHSFCADGFTRLLFKVPNELEFPPEESTSYYEEWAFNGPWFLKFVIE